MSAVSRLKSILTLATAAVALALSAAPDARGAEPFAASGKAIELDRKIDWSRVKLIAVQEGERYKTLDSFAREQFAKMYGSESLPGLSPLGSLFEWLFNHEAYADTPLIRVKDLGIRRQLTLKMPEADRMRILHTSFMTPREIEQPDVQKRIDEIAPKTQMRTAYGRLANALGAAQFMSRMMAVLPPPGEDTKAAWYPIEQLYSNAAQAADVAGTANLAAIEQKFGPAVPGYNPDQAFAILAPWREIETGWKKGDAGAVQHGLDRLAEILPQLEPRVYPPLAQRQREALYYKLGRMNWGFGVYLLGALVSILALVTGWRSGRWTGITILIAGLAIHGYAIGLRWAILGRIPNANMFEALTFAAWIGIAVALLLELFLKKRIFLVAANLAGFLALLLAGYVVPGGGTITSIMTILDDLMLRIHTTLIITSYALVFIAAVIALTYLFTYYLYKAPGRSLESGVICALFGAGLLFAAWKAFAVTDLTMSGFEKLPNVGFGSWIASGILVPLLALLGRFSVTLAIGLTIALLSTLTLAIGDHGFIQGMGWTFLGVGAVWAIGNGISFTLPRGDEFTRSAPEWLKNLDWCHVIVLNIVFICLFVGVILGAVWADYSWGRPWGWDPKEVFALNTWLIYAILIHVRFVVKERGLWTAWLSVAGCLMMAFNWCFVNFYLVGLHSYA